MEINHTKELSHGYFIDLAGIKAITQHYTQSIQYMTITILATLFSRSQLRIVYTMMVLYKLRSLFGVRQVDNTWMTALFCTFLNTLASTVGNGECCIQFFIAQLVTYLYCNYLCSCGSSGTMKILNLKIMKLSHKKCNYMIIHTLSQGLSVVEFFKE